MKHSMAFYRRRARHLLRAMPFVERGPHLKDLTKDVLEGATLARAAEDWNIPVALVRRAVLNVCAEALRHELTPFTKEAKRYD